MTAREFRGRRQALGMTQYDLARALGVSQQTVWRMETGARGRALTQDPERPVPPGLARRIDTAEKTPAPHDPMTCPRCHGPTSVAGEPCGEC